MVWFYCVEKKKGCFQSICDLYINLSYAVSDVLMGDACWNSFLSKNFVKILQCDYWCCKCVDVLYECDRYVGKIGKDHIEISISLWIWATLTLNQAFEAWY